MTWVALDRSIRDAETYCLEAPLENWREVRDQIHETVCREGFNEKKQSFVQTYGKRKNWMEACY